jgi:2-polyprenyl-3-methyl-5-hydroxy-6-metoxy-1,4-benzoquinol methylase
VAALKLPGLGPFLKERTAMTLTHARLEDRYFRRMAAATDEKAQLLDRLAPGTVVDVGTGGGELATRMAEHPASTRSGRSAISGA